MKTVNSNQNDPYKILLVDDDVSLIKTLEKILSNKNYVLYSALSGEDALKQIPNIVPDLILLDIFMPKMDGYQVCDTLKQDERFSDIPIIFITESNNPDCIIKAFEHGGVDYVIKPFNSKVFLARVETHLQLKNYQESLKELNKVKLKFFSIMTQDIKDSLIGVKGIAGFLVQDLEQGNGSITEGIKMAKILQDDSKRLYKFLENLIEWASIEIGQVKIKPKEIKVAEFIRQTIKVLEIYAVEKRLELNLSCKEDITTNTDPYALKTIFLKIFSNAIKYCNPEGKIEITVSKNGNKCLFIISDNGVGMSPEVFNNVFRLDTPHPKTIGTAEEKGTGLGLIICKALIDRISGKIAIDSKKFRGATVTFEIPDLD
jgi:two-component system, sensor histidine kinase and response regulator